MKIYLTTWRYFKVTRRGEEPYSQIRWQEVTLISDDLAAAYNHFNFQHRDEEWPLNHKSTGEGVLLCAVPIDSARAYALQEAGVESIPYREYTGL